MGVAGRHVAVGAFITALYIVGGVLIGGDALPTVIGGVLAGVLAVLVLRDVEARRRRRGRGG